MVTETCGLEQAVEAFERAQAPDVMKIMVHVSA